MTFAQTERTELCDLLDVVGPDAPTLCAGWSAHDLAAHLWIRETDPLAIPGMLARPLSGLTERRLAETKQRFPFVDLVDKLRHGPARFSVFAFPGVDEGANTTEFFVHHEDVRRAGDHPSPPRDLGAEDEDWVWRRLKLLGRAFFRRAKVGVVLERAVDPALSPRDEPESLRVMGGSATVTLVGQPSELLLFAHGRNAVAAVKLVGESESIDLLNGTELST
ncbi:MAG: TIGR03085 family metal-binding protein [Propionibacteriaceae bacterium]